MIRFSSLFISFIFINTFLSPLYQEEPFYTPLKPLPDATGIIIEDQTKIIPFSVTEPSGVQLEEINIQGGIPIPKNTIYNTENLIIRYKDKIIPAQFKVLSRWWNFKENKKREVSDYAIKWLLLNFKTSLLANQKKSFQLVILNKPKKASISNPIRVHESLSQIQVNTGPLVAIFDKQNGVLKEINIHQKKMLKSPVEIFSELRHIPLPDDERVTNLVDLKSKDYWYFSPDPEFIGEKQKWYSRSHSSKDWSTFNPMRPWTDQGFEDYHGQAWLRANFHIPKQNINRKVVFKLLNRFKWHYKNKKRNFSIYLNDKKIADIDYSNRNLLSKGIELNKYLHPSKSQLLAIRIYDAGAEAGFKNHPVIQSPYLEKIDGPWPDLNGRYSNLNHHAKVKVDSGPIKTSIEVHGTLTNLKKVKSMQYIVYYHFHRLSSHIDISYTFIHTQDPQRIRYKSIGMNFPLNLNNTVSINTPEWNQNYSLSSKEKVSLFQYHDGIGRYPGYPDLTQNPLNLKYTVYSNQKNILNQGKQSLGYLSLNNQKQKVSLLQSDFWESYPSELSYDQSQKLLTAYMWPEKAEELDLRAWPQRKDNRWDKLESNQDKKFDQDIKRKVLYKIKAYDGWDSSIGLAWTRNFKLCFDDHKIKNEILAHRSISMTRAPLPYVNDQYNSQTEAFGLPLHPYDPINFPRLELKTEANLKALALYQKEWAKVYGMFYYGALQYYFNPNKQRMKLTWLRRWIHHENSESPATTPLIQYLRSGYRPHFNLGESLARFENDVTIISYSPKPYQKGVGRKHRTEVWSRGIINHTNIEGILLYYFLTGDERVQKQLNEAMEAQLKRDISSYSYDGRRLLFRSHDASMLNMALFWFFSGDHRCKMHLERSINYYKHLDEKGFTGIGGASYRISLLKRCWYLTRDNRFYDLIHSNKLRSNKIGPIEYFVKQDSQALMTAYVNGMGKFREQPPFLRKVAPIKSRNILNQLKITPQSYGVPSGYPGLLQAAIYKAKLPSIEHGFWKDQQFLNQAYYLDPKKVSIEKDTSFKTINLRHLVNDNPYQDRAPYPTLSKLGLHHVFKDQSIPLQTSLKDSEIGFDIGPLSANQDGWFCANGDAIYPSFEGYESGLNYVGYPFGATVSYQNIPFHLIDPKSNSGKGFILLHKGVHLKIELNRKSKRLYFLGQTALSKMGDFDSIAATYKVHYSDGSIQNVDLKPYLHFDHALSNRMTAPKTNYLHFKKIFDGDPDYGLIHMNIFTLNTNPDKIIEEVELIGKDSTRIAIFAITAELLKKNDQKDTKTAIDITTSLNSNKNVLGKIAHYNLQIPEGPHHLELEFNRELRARQLYIAINGKVAVGGLIVKRPKNLTIPYLATKKDTEITIYGKIRKPLHNIVNKLFISKCQDDLSWTNQRPKISNLLCYGWDREIRTDTDYKKSSNLQRDFGKVSGRTFKVDLPNAKYLVDTYVFSKEGINKCSIQMNDTHSQAITLEGQELYYPYHACHSYKKISMETKVKNNTLSIKFLNKDFYSRGIHIRRLP